MADLPSDKVSPDKACQILHDGTAQGHPLTDEQRKMFGAACGHTKNSEAGLLSRFISWLTANAGIKPQFEPAEDELHEYDAPAELVGTQTTPDGRHISALMPMGEPRALSEADPRTKPDDDRPFWPWETHNADYTENVWSDAAREAAEAARMKGSYGHVPGHQGHSEMHKETPYHQTLTKHGFQYSHTTPVHGQEGDYLHHTYTHPQMGERKIGVSKGQWASKKSSAYGSAVGGSTVAGLEKHIQGLKKRSTHNAEGVTKKEGPEHLSSEDYAYVPDPKEPSTWKLRIDDAKHVGAAVAALSGAGYRGQKVDIPAADRSKVVAKVRAAWKKYHGKDEEIPKVLNTKGSEVIDNLDFDSLPDNAKKAAFAHMGGGSGSEVSKEAGEASQRALSTGKAHHHTQAAALHKAAAQHHREQGNEGHAQVHEQAARFHAKAAKKGTRNVTRNDRLAALTANCSCDRDRQALNALSDEMLEQLTANTASASGDGASGVRAGNIDEDEDDYEPSSPRIKEVMGLAKNAKNAKKGKPPEEDDDEDEDDEMAKNRRWFASAPKKIQEVVGNMLQRDKEQRTQLVKALVGNAQGKHREVLVGAYKRLSLNELEAAYKANGQTQNADPMADLFGDVGNVDALYMGAAAPAGPVGNTSSNYEQEVDIPWPPTMNYEEAKAKRAV